MGSKRLKLTDVERETIYDGVVDIEKTRHLIREFAPPKMERIVQEKFNVKPWYVKKIKAFEVKHIEILSYMVELCLSHRELINSKKDLFNKI